MNAVRVAYTLEQCWHRPPGGTAASALAVARELARRDDVELAGVAGRHRRDPPPPWVPPIPVAQLPLARPWLYEAWLRLGWPPVERATGPVDVTHATDLVPCPTKAPLVVTVHDLAFVHDPAQFTRHGVRVMTRSLAVTRDHAALVITPSAASAADCETAGIDSGRLRVIPHGVDAAPVTADDIHRVRVRHDLPQRFVLFVGTIEPRKNLTRLAGAVGRLAEPMPLVVAGADGWGVVRDRIGAAEGADVRFLGFVDSADLAALYTAATVFAYPSEREGFGMPVAEAMAHGTPVVTSRGTSTEEVAGGAAVLVDPFDVDAIADGLERALADGDRLSGGGLRRAAELSWQAAAELTVAAYRDVT